MWKPKRKWIEYFRSSFFLRIPLRSEPTGAESFSSPWMMHASKATVNNGRRKSLLVYYLLAFDLPLWRLSLVSNFFSFTTWLVFHFSVLFCSHCVLSSICSVAGLLESARNGPDGGSQARRSHRRGGGPSWLANQGGHCRGRAASRPPRQRHRDSQSPAWLWTEESGVRPRSPS